jgi:hypothetical protein
MAVDDGAVVRAVARMSFWGTDPCYNVYFFQNVSGSSLGNAETLDDMSEILNGLYGNFDQLQSINFEYDDILVHNVSADLPVGNIDWLSLEAGTENTTNLLPQQAAALVSFPTEALSVLGRKYLGGFTELSSGDGGGLSAGLLAALAPYAAALVDTITATNGEWLPGVWSTVLETFVPYLSSRIDDVFQTQRRRVFGN